MATWTVKYIPRNGDTICETTVTVDMYDAKFTATNLGLWGCGKEAYSPIWAIKNLVQDMARIIEATPNN